MRFTQWMAGLARGRTPTAKDGRLLAFGCTGKQLQQGDIELVGQGEQDLDGRIVVTSLEASDDVRMYARLQRQRFLAQVPLLTPMTDLFAQTPQDRCFAHAQESARAHDTV